MDKVITSMLLIIAAVVATVVVVNAVLPSIQRTGNDIVAASDVVGSRIRSDDKIDVFFGESDGFERIAYDEEPTCPNPSPPPRTAPCWQFQLENDTQWAP